MIHLTLDWATLVAIFDGRGAWGNGHEAAAWTRDSLQQRWAATPPTAADVVFADIVAAAESVPAYLHDTDFGWAFCGLAVVVSDMTLEIIAAGNFECCEVTPTGLRHLYRTATLLDQALAAGHITADMAADFPLADISSGPWLAEGDGRSPRLACVRDRIASPGHRAPPPDCATKHP